MREWRRELTPRGFRPAPPGRVELSVEAELVRFRVTVVLDGGRVAAITGWGWSGTAVTAGSELAAGRSRGLCAPHVRFFELTHGLGPVRVPLLHSCDETGCAAVDHLSVGTQVLNVAQRAPPRPLLPAAHRRRGSAWRSPAGAGRLKLRGVAPDAAVCGYTERVTELVNDERVGEGSGGRPPGRREPHGDLRVGLLLGALGVVYGDIGTSPLYSVQTVFAIDHGAVRPTARDVFGVVSLIFWSITLIVSIKYVVFVMRSDNDGEGGVMALAALARRVLSGVSAGRAKAVMVLGVLGAALFYGDSVITPAISVLSAIEGVEVGSPSLAHLVLPLAAAILTILFVGQRFGTQRVGALFGPVMVVWFTAIGVAGLREVVHGPAILRGLSPSYAVVFIVDRPYTAFIAMGAVVLAITGAEALYADMGHFGRAPIRAAWFVLVFPALTLNYLAQGALILRNPASRSNPFFLLLPTWSRVPMVVLATAATVIASQAVISGAYSMTRQALRLGFLPRLRVRQTSAEQEGQIYIPAVNWGLFTSVLVVTFAFRSSARLATAYGVAVTGTFLITTTLLLLVARAAWHWRRWQLAAVVVAFGVPELTYFTANLTKVSHGGWLTLLIAAIMFIIMTTWQRGRELVTDRRVTLEGPLPEFLDVLRHSRVHRVPGIAVFPHPTKETTPLALRANVAYNHVLHRLNVIITGRTAAVPHIPWEERLTLDSLGDPRDGILHIDANFGFQDPTDFPEVLRRALLEVEEEAGADPTLEPEGATYFVSRISLRRSRQPGLATWRKVIFITLAQNAASQAEFLGLPPDRTVTLGSEVPV